MTLPPPLDTQTLATLPAQRLAGDASGREYSRVRLPDGTTIVKMDVHHPFEADKDDWLNLRAYLEQCGVPVPGLRRVAADKGVIFIEDCGDVLMESRAKNAEKMERLALYQKALDILLAMQTGATKNLTPQNPAAQRQFDAGKYLWELNHTTTHYIKGYLGKTLSALDEERLANFFQRLITPILAEPMVFSHRDYHSRNLLVDGGKWTVIDFQDARLGPPQYDLASLLFDSYVKLEEDEREDLLGYYLDKAQTALPGHASLNSTAFVTMLHRVALQRNIKALGTFGYQATIRKNPLYTQFMPDTAGYVRRNLPFFDDLSADAEWVLSLLTA